MKKIPLTKGKVALVDDADYDRVAPFKWCASWSGKSWYALTRIKGTGQPGKKMYMHRFLLGAVRNRQGDHKDGDGLNNQKKNLRLATSAQNGQNRGAQKDNTSGFKGVSVRVQKDRTKWIAQIKSDGSSTMYIGIYDTARQAALAYDAEARRLHGQFANLNFGNAL